MDVQELWKKACELLRNETNAYIYDYISKNLSPVKLEQDVLVLRIPMEPMKVMVNNRYAAVISTCLSEVAGHAITARILTQEEIDSILSEFGGFPLDDEDLAAIAGGMPTARPEIRDPAGFRPRS